MICAVFFTLISSFIQVTQLTVGPSHRQLPAGRLSSTCLSLLALEPVTISNVPAVLCDTEGRVRCPPQASAAGWRSLPGVSDRPSHHVRMRVSHVRGTGASVRSASWTGRGHWSLIRSSAGLAPGVPARGPGFLQVSHEMPRILEPAFQGRPARRRGLRGGANRSFCPSVGLVSL